MVFRSLLWNTQTILTAAFVQQKLTNRSLLR